MDSLKTYSTDASRGGPAGEILVRTCLTTVLQSLYNPSIDVCGTDFEMELMGSLSSYDLYVFDPWTWAGKGWRLRAFVKDPSKVVILDFFGTETTYVDRNGGLGGGFDVQRNVLRAYPNKGTEGKGTFLGFYLPEPDEGGEAAGDAGDAGTGLGEAKVVIWGKDPSYFTPPVLRMIAALSSLPSVTLVSPLPLSGSVALPPSVVRTGHLTADKYHDLLKSATHLLGLGHPLLGPSGVEAVSYGCVLVNPRYEGGVKGYETQHDYVREYVGEKNCEYE
ncbi:hypothetical protein TrRE_jg2333 [Triparma retinervis]|uniref:Glycosyltransferase family 18 catalytic domain-containing protein n=1 Tax=Triparma retinervis TaxID=2557542 RepID=A0A9W6ZG72_9STRA|nr:hypothetical protein TrRE_jg2333 [Triparma retinervis]